ncbi:MAG: TonB-dependent receptor [Acidobacteriia bacterium]|nr:TonB-dependent receptor [Terriglobia bacterium]
MSCSLSICLQAQTVTGTILGTVLDTSGAAIANAAITITNQDTGVVRNTASNADGLYNVPSLLPGRYTVAATAQGFNQTQVKDVVLAVGSNAHVDLNLLVGSTNQQVTVSESIPTVETTSSEVSQVMDEELIQSIPLNARDVQQLAVIQPGVLLMNTSGYGGKAMSAAGDRPINNRFLQEGIDLTTTYRTSPYNLASFILLGVEAVKEFKVLSIDLPAEYGEQSGGTVNTLFKSGTNTLHGSAYEYYRNSAIDARNFFDATTSAPPLHRHQFGASVGGPIRKDKTFFFGNFEGLRLNAAQTFVADVPDANARTGIINGVSIIRNPADTAALAKIQQLFFSGANPLYPVCNGGPVANGTTGLCLYNSNPIATTSENYYLVKIDHSFGSKNTLSSSYNMDRGWRTSPNQIGTNQDDRVNNRQTFTLQDSHIFSPNVVNTARFGINRTWYNDQKDMLDAGFVPGTSRFDPSIFPIKELVPCATVCTGAASTFPSGVTTPLPTIAVNGGLTTFGGTAQAFDFAPRWIGYTTGLLSDDVNYLKGKHALQFGVEGKRWYDNIAQYRGNPIGAWTFPSLTAFLRGDPAQTFGFDLQPPPNAATGGGTYGRNFAQHLIALYAQDTFKLLPNLTLNYGLRWEYVPGPTEKNNKMANLPNPLTATAPVIGPYLTSSKDNFAPRFGFNWDPFKKGKTSIRGGFGIFFNEIEDSTYFTTGTNQFPFVTSVSVTNMPFPFNQSILNTDVSGKLANPSFGTFEAFPHTPTKYGYNLTIQQELPDHFSLMVAYVGATQRHQGRLVSWQEYQPTAVETPGQVPQFNGVAIPGAAINPNCKAAGQITCLYWAGAGTTNANVLGTGAPTGLYATDCTATVTSNCFNNNNFSPASTGVYFDANSNYNSLQVALERQVSNGLFLRFNYTWSKCFEDASDDLAGGESNGGGAAWSPTLNANANYHPCSFTGNNAANFSLNYDLPFGRMVSNGIAKQILSGWTINSLTSVFSGVPFDVREGVNTSRAASTGVGSGHPDWASGCDTQNIIQKKNVQNYIKGLCLVASAPGYLGDMGPLVLNAPTTANTDISLKRMINLKFHEGMNVLLSADMFNAFNRTNLSPPASTTVFAGAARNGTIGQITSTIGTSRQFQIGVKMQF